MIFGFEIIFYDDPCVNLFVSTEKTNSSTGTDEFPLQREDQVSERPHQGRAGTMLQCILGVFVVLSPVLKRGANDEL